MVFVARWQRATCGKKLDQLTQICHVLAAFFSQLHIPPKLRSVYQVAQGLDVQVIEQSGGRFEALSLTSIGGLQGLRGGRVGHLDVKWQGALRGHANQQHAYRSEERRVGKEGRSRGS